MEGFVASPTATGVALVKHQSIDLEPGLQAFRGIHQPTGHDRTIPNTVGPGEGEMGRQVPVVLGPARLLEGGSHGFGKPCQPPVRIGNTQPDRPGAVKAGERTAPADRDSERALPPRSDADRAAQVGQSILRHGTQEADRQMQGFEADPARPSRCPASAGPSWINIRAPDARHEIGDE